MSSRTAVVTLAGIAVAGLLVGAIAVLMSKKKENRKCFEASYGKEIENIRQDGELTNDEEQEDIVVEEEEEEKELADIEDLVGKSIIPQTLKQMKESNFRPYTTKEKKEKVDELEAMPDIPSFAAHLRKNQVSLKRNKTTVMNLNIGFYCNQACSHCHVDSSPRRKEMMTHQVAEQCVNLIRNSPSVKVVDLTGGAPELNREFKFIVEECSKLGVEIIDRCNLTVLLEPHQQHLPHFLAQHKVHIIASLPCYLESNVDKQRGDQIFQRSIKALKILNNVGYGIEGTGLEIDLVYNPTGVHLPPSRTKLEGDYKRVLAETYGIKFNKLHCITNMPINRFYDHLKGIGALEKYMHILVDNFNSSTCSQIMCTSYISVDPAGLIYDCDFNQQVGLTLPSPAGQGNVPLSVFHLSCTDELLQTPIKTKKHCFGCTAGAGSS